MGTLLADLRYAVRGLLRSPGFSSVALLTLALGIGANTAIFSLVNRTLLQPPPFEDPSRLVAIWQSRPQSARNPASYLDFKDWRAQSQAFESMTLFRETEVSLSGEPAPKRFPAALVSADFFRTLGVIPERGRVFDSGEDGPGRDMVTVLGHDLWLQRYGGDPAVIGRAITIEGKSLTVLGVAPRGFHYPQSAQLWLPVSHDSPDMFDNRGLHGYSVVGRLRSGVSLEQARMKMVVVSEQLAGQYPESNARTSTTLVPLSDDLVRNLRPTLLILLAAVGFVLLIAAANVANMMLARANARSREIAIRTALGASRVRLMRQLLTESLVLALAGGVLGLLFASWGIDLLPAMRTDMATGSTSLDTTVLSFALAVSLLTGILFGVVPALRAGQVNLNPSIAETARITYGPGRQRVRGVLVVVEVALSLLLLVGAGLMLRSLVLLQSVHPGFNPRQVLTAELSLPAAKYRDTTAVIRFYDALVGRLATLPGVTSAAAVSYVPLGNKVARYRFIIDGQPAGEPMSRPSADLLVVTPGFFETLEIPLLKGRGFLASDRWSAPPVVVINQTMARRYWPRQTAIGKRMSLGDPEDNAWLEVVGIVGDVKYRGLSQEVRPQVYAPHSQAGNEGMSLVVRTSATPLSLTGAVERQVLALDPGQPISAVQTMDHIIGLSITAERSRTVVLGCFAVLALLLASVGVYGVVAYGVTQRVREIGVRVALGAATKDVLTLIVRQGMVLVVIGVLAGSLLALVLSRALTSLLYEVRPTDPLTLAAVATLVLVVALAACVIPARRAARVDPVIALRSE